MRFDPHAPRSLLGPLKSVCEALDLPAPTSVNPLRPPTDIGHYGLTLEGGVAVWLQVDLGLVDGAGFFAALSASRLTADEPVPMPRPVAVPGFDLLGCWAMVGPLPRGQNAGALVASDPTRRADVCRALGRLAATLAEVPVPRWGCGAGPEGFRRRAASWGAEWRERVERHADLARARGAAPPLLEELLDRVDPEVLVDPAPSLVHGGLGPDAICLADGEISAVIGWEGALAGDALADLGPLLHLPGELLGAVVEGYGIPEGLIASSARLEVYAASHAVRLFAAAGAPALDEHERARRLEHAVDVGRTALDGTLKERLGGSGAVHAAGRTRVPVRRAVELLRLEPLPGDGAAGWRAAAATAAVAHDLARTEMGAGWRDVAERYLESIDRGRGPRVPGRSASWAQAAALAVRRCATGEGALRTDALSTLWLARELADRLAAEVDATSVAGAAEWAAFAPAGGADSLGSVESLLAAVMGLAAIRGLEDVLGPIPGADALAPRLVAQARVAWEVLEVADPGEPVQGASIVARYADVAAHGTVAVPVAPLLLATRRVQAELPSHPSAIFAALGVPVR